MFLNEFASWYGVPYVLHTDQGTNFESNLFKVLNQIFNIMKMRTTPYYQECDKQVERMNSMIIDLIKLNARDATNNWNLNIKLTLMAYRSAVKSSTGNTSNFLLDWRKMRLPFELA